VTADACGVCLNPALLIVVSGILAVAGRVVVSGPLTLRAKAVTVLRVGQCVSALFQRDSGI